MALAGRIDTIVLIGFAGGSRALTRRRSGRVSACPRRKISLFPSYPPPSADPAATMPPAAPDPTSAAMTGLHDNHLRVPDKIIRQERKVLVDRQRRCLDNVGHQAQAARSGGRCDCRAAHHAPKELSTIHRFHFPFLRVPRPLILTSASRTRRRNRKPSRSIAQPLSGGPDQMTSAVWGARMKCNYRETFGSDARMRSEKSGASSAACATSLIKERRRSSSNDSDVFTRPE